MKRINVNQFSYMLIMLDAIIFKMTYGSLCFYLHYKTYALAMQLFYVKLTLHKKELFSKRGDVPTFILYVLQRIYLQNIASKKRQVNTFGGTIYFAVDGT